MTTINVSNSAQLQSALNHAAGGDTIVLAGGNYGAVNFSNRNYSSGVTIKSASLSSQAHFDYLGILRSSNLTFDGIDVGHARRPGENYSTHYARVTDSDNIKMIGMAFHGSLDNNPSNDGIGMNVTNSDHFQLIGSTFRDLYRGVYFQQDADVTVVSNSFQMIRSDGLDFGAVTGAVIDKNSFTNFHPAAGDHADAIQFWLTGQPHGSSDIKITNNTIMQGSGAGLQGIFISDPTRFDYKNVLIQNNLVYGNDQYHGIFLNGVHGAQVIGNTLLSQSNDHKMMWIDLNSGSNFVVKDNLADTILVQHGVTGVTMSHNASLAQMASIRSLIPNLNAPKSVHDLIVHDYGYHVPGSTVPGAGPVATALGGGIGSTIDGHGATGAQVTKTATAELTPVLPTVSEVFPTAVHAEPMASIGHGHWLSAQPLFRVHIDHFAALP
jgi:hypothetical protein